MSDKFQKQVERIIKLDRQYKYDKAKKEIHKLKCKYLSPTEETKLKEIGRVYDYEDKKEIALETLGEEFGDREIEDYKKWLNQSKSDLKELYKCSLTGDYCVARGKSFRSADLSSGDYPYVYLEIDIQRRCPAFENNLEKKNKR